MSKKMKFLAFCLSFVMLFSACASKSEEQQKSSTSQTQTKTEKKETQENSEKNEIAVSETNAARPEAKETGGMHSFEGETAGMPVFPDEFNTEEYSSIEENVFQAVASSPLSTFAADVDTASYANIRRMIEGGELPLPDMVRIEEMLNYFHYDYPEPLDKGPFSVSMELADCPWNPDTELLLIGLQAKKIDTKELQPSNLVFLIDVSGSMDEPDKLPLVKRAFGLLSEQLGDQDRISIVTYASSDQVVAKGLKGSEKADIMRAIEDLYAAGGTAGSKGIETAYELAEEYFIEGGNNRVILATDGDLNLGITSEGELARLISEKKKSGVFLSVLGFGEGNIKDNKMETLADKGNGNYSYIDSIYEARKVLVEEMGGTCHTLAKDVKLQVEFNPVYIKGYRLIGYENRVMDDEDFADDKKDGGEIGAGHRVSALYEIVPIDSEFEIGSDLKYQSAEKETKNTGELLTLSIRYKKPDEDASTLLEYTLGESSRRDTLSSNMSFAAAVVEVGMLLRDSEFAGSSSYENALALLEASGDLREDESKYEFRSLIKKLMILDQENKESEKE
ncbi:MAG: VWA domain-containing protein [Johnsonella sp.]|nr:VWA domain-containing protein [Johnsonella sp.]